MEKLTKKELRERIHNKAWSKIQALERELIDLYKIIEKGGDGRLGLELIGITVKGTHREIQVWTEILRLNEIENKDE